MKWSLNTVLVITLLVLQVKLEGASIRGVVKDFQSGEPLKFATVGLMDSDQGTVTDVEGKFLMKDLSAGNYTFVFSHLGYQQQTYSVTLREDEIKDIVVLLKTTSTSLQQVVIESTITEAEGGVDKIAGSAEYISPKQLQQFNYSDVNRIVKSVPGIYIQEEDGYGLRPNIGLRGTGVERSSKITLMEDGVLIAPAPYSAPAAYYFPTVGRMHAIEVLKGSSQIKYGPYTTGGAINLISTPVPDEAQAEVQLSTGSYGYQEAYAGVGSSFKHGGFWIETFQYGADGFKRLDGGSNTGFNKEDYLAKIQLNSDPSLPFYQAINMKLGIVNENSNETYLGLTEEDFEADPYRRYAASQNDLMISDQTQISLSHFMRFSKHMKVYTTAYRNDFKRNWYKLDKVVDTSGRRLGLSSVLDNPNNYFNALQIVKGDYNSANNALEMKANNRSYRSQGIQTRLERSFSTEKSTSKVELGLRIHQDEVDRFQWVDKYAISDRIMYLTEKGIRGTESNRLRKAEAFAAYLKYKYTYQKLAVSMGVRYENISLEEKNYGKNDITREGTELTKKSNKEQVILPGIGLNYKVNEFLSAFTGFHIGFAPAGVNEGSRTEQSSNYELGVRYNKYPLEFSLIGFYSAYKNLLGTDLAASGGNGTNLLFNGGRARVYGVEFKTSTILYTNLKKNYKIPFLVAYTGTVATFLSEFESDFEGWGAVDKGDEFPYLASNQLYAVLSMETKRIDFNISAKYLDPMRTEPGQGAIVSSRSTDRSFMLDLGAQYKINSNFTGFFSLTNLFDSPYIVARRPSGLRPTMPRMIEIGVRAIFNKKKSIHE